MRASIWTTVAALSMVGCGSDVKAPAASSDAAAIEHDAQAFISALKPRDDRRPVIAVLAFNEATETTDFLLSHAVLRRSGVAEVHAVAPHSGRVDLYPALQVEGVQDLASFDAAHPAGADYVIVPAMDDADDPTITAWLNRQAGKGARIVGVCAGALIVGRAGLLDGRRFVTHWYFRDDVLDRHPNAQYVPDRRYVVDGRVATTTGITASVPTMLALVEAIGGRERAQALAEDLGVSSWTPKHDSSSFGLDAQSMARFVLNKIAFWRRETWAVEVHDGTDDIALAFAADAWSRTGRISIEASALNPVKLASGLTLIARPADETLPRLSLASALAPMHQLDRTLCEIGQRFGEPRRDWVMMELEYARADPCSGPQ
jgi:putative intracellular protease/amidase